MRLSRLLVAWLLTTGLAWANTVNGHDSTTYSDDIFLGRKCSDSHLCVYVCYQSVLTENWVNESSAGSLGANLTINGLAGGDFVHVVNATGTWYPYAPFPNCNQDPASHGQSNSCWCNDPGICSGISYNGYTVSLSGGDGTDDVSGGHNTGQTIYNGDNNDDVVVASSTYDSDILHGDSGNDIVADRGGDSDSLYGDNNSDCLEDLSDWAWIDCGGGTDLVAASPTAHTPPCSDCPLECGFYVPCSCETPVSTCF